MDMQKAPAVTVDFKAATGQYVLDQAAQDQLVPEVSSMGIYSDLEELALQKNPGLAGRLRISQDFETGGVALGW